MPRPLPPALRELLADDPHLQNSTLQGFRSAWRDLLEWAVGADIVRSAVELEDGELVQLLRPDVIAEYLEARRSLARSTLNTRIQGIRHVASQGAGPDPFEAKQVRDVWEEIRAEKRAAKRESRGPREERPKYQPGEIIEEGPALLEEHLSARGSHKEERDLRYLPRESARPSRLTEDQIEVIPPLEYDLPVLRDRALLLLLATTTVSRADLLRLNVEDICPPGTYPDPSEPGRNGDQAAGGLMPIGVVGRGPRGDMSYLMEVVPSPASEPERCPSRALAAWVLAANLTEGPLFRKFTPSRDVGDRRLAAQTVNHVIKRWAERAGLDPGEWTTRRLQG